MTKTYTATFAESDGWIVAWTDDVAGALAQERTIEEARESLKEAIQLILETEQDAITASGGRIVAREPITVEV